MNSDQNFVERVRESIREQDGASDDILRQIDEELERRPSAQLWILRGDAIQLSEGEGYELEDAEESYHRAIELDPGSPDAYESLAFFVFAVKDDAQSAIEQKLTRPGFGPPAASRC